MSWLFLYENTIHKWTWRSLWSFLRTCTGEFTRVCSCSSIFKLWRLIYNAIPNHILLFIITSSVVTLNKQFSNKAFLSTSKKCFFRNAFELFYLLKSVNCQNKNCLRRLIQFDILSLLLILTRYINLVKILHIAKTNSRKSSDDWNMCGLRTYLIHLKKLLFKQKKLKNEVLQETAERNSKSSISV